MSQDLYAILGVTYTATDTEIKKSYRKLAIIYHPDKNKDGAERFKEISHAYSILSDPEKRRSHDLKNTSTYASSSFRSSYFNSTPTPNPYDTWNFNHGFYSPGPPPPKSRPAHRQAPPRPAPPPRAKTPPPSPPPPPPKRSDYNIHISVKISLEDSYMGTSKFPITYQETINCTTCNGQLNQTKRVRECLHCQGTGSMISRLQQDKVRCAYCQGTGRESFFLNCRSCDGKKTQERAMKIKIPHGIHDSQPLRVDDRGNLMPDKKTRGDVHIKILVPTKSQDGFFTRQGDNLHCKIPISLKDAIMGFHSKRFGNHLNGQPLTLSQPYGHVIKPDSRRVIKGQGMPIFQSKEPIKYGKLYIKFDVVFPDTVNILESPSDKGVIDLLLETPEERKARENVIVIDDDEEPVAEEEEEEDELHEEVSSTEEDLDELMDHGDDDVIELETPPPPKTTSPNTARRSTSNNNTPTSADGYSRKSNGQSSNANYSSFGTYASGRSSFKNNSSDSTTTNGRSSYTNDPSYSTFTNGQSSSTNNTSYSTSRNGQSSSSSHTRHEDTSPFGRPIPTPTVNSSPSNAFKRSVDEMYEEIEKDYSGVSPPSPKKYKAASSSNYYDLDSSGDDDNEEIFTKAPSSLKVYPQDQQKNKGKSSTTSGRKRTEKKSIPDLFAEILGFATSRDQAI